MLNGDMWNLGHSYQSFDRPEKANAFANERCVCVCMHAPPPSSFNTNCRFRACTPDFVCVCVHFYFVFMFRCFNLFSVLNLNLKKQNHFWIVQRTLTKHYKHQIKSICLWPASQQIHFHPNCFWFLFIPIFRMSIFAMPKPTRIC